MLGKGQAKYITDDDNNACDSERFD